MPRIQGYEQQVSAGGQIPTRQANASDFGGTGLMEVGRGIQSAGQDLGYAQRQMQIAESQRQVTDIHVALQKLRADYTTKALDAEAKADPSDTGLGNRFLFGQSGEGDEGSLKWALDTYREGITDPIAKLAFERGAADLTTHFTLHFAQAQSRMAGTYAKQQAIEIINAAQSTIQTDPSQYQSVLQETLAAVDDPRGIFFRPGMDAGSREQIKRGVTEQLSSSAVRGMIRDSPQHALHSLMTGEWDHTLSGEQKVTLLTAADTAVKAQEVAARQAEAEKRRQLEELQERTAEKLTSAYILHRENPGNPEYKPVDATMVAKEMAKHQLDDGVGRAIIHMMDSDAKEPVQRTDYNTYWSLFKRISLPWGHPQKLLDIAEVYNAAPGRLKPSDVSKLQEEFFKAKTDKGLKLSEDRRVFLDSMKSSITWSMLGKLDQVGDIKFGQFHHMVLREEEKAFQENRDPHDLYNPDSKFYLGRRLPQYKRTIDEQLEETMKVFSKTPNGIPQEKQRLPGETPQQYLERMKK